MNEMQHDDVLKKLNSIFQEVLGNEEIELRDETTAADIEEWDSLTNIRILVQIEQDFNISFSSAEIADIPNVGELVRLIVARIN